MTKHLECKKCQIKFDPKDTKIKCSKCGLETKQMTYKELANGWKATIYEDGTDAGKPAFWKSHGKVIEVKFGRLTPKDALI